jgi:DNA topoisomerase-2
LNEAIIGMAQDFMGSNTIPWLVPQGQFGTRLQGGKDSASPRYIHTYLQPIVPKLVPAADFPILRYRDDDGHPVEPDFYAPILPMLLINGARGIGTGYSTFIPSCDPAALKAMLLAWLGGDAEALTRPIPLHVKGFKGTITADGTVTGVSRTEKEDVVITELPPGTWTQDYREFLEAELAEGRIKEFSDTSTDTDVCIRIRGMAPAALLKSITEKIKLTNMHAFNARGQITKYASLNAILAEYAETRLALYETRRLAQIAALQAELPYHEDVMRFLEDQVSDSPALVLRKASRETCTAALATQGYRLVKGSYDYLFRLPMSSLTTEQIATHAATLASLRAESARLSATTAADLWRTELSGV